MNTLRVDGEIFESGEKKLRIQKYPDTCERDLSLYPELLLIIAQGLCHSL